MATLQTHMQETATALGVLSELTTTALGTTTTAIASALANSALYSSTSFDQQYLLAVSGNNLGEQQPIAAGGLTVASGTLTVSSGYTNAVASGVSLWAAGRLPLIRHGQFQGIRECVNRAYRRLLVRDRIDLTGVDNQQIYLLPLTTYPWMRSDSILEIYDPQTDATVPLRETRHRWQYKEDAESPALEFPNGAPWKTGETASMLVQIPANARMKIAGVWTNSASETTALTTLTDETLAAIQDVKVVALAYCYQELAKWASGTEAEEWRSEERKWAKRARALPNFRRQQRENDGLPDLNPVRIQYARAAN